MVAQLIRMGFSEHDARAALDATSYRGTEYAVTLLLGEAPRGGGSGDTSLASPDVERPRGGGSGDKSLASPRDVESGGASSSNIPPPQDESARTGTYGVVEGSKIQFRLRDLKAVVLSDPLEITIE